uniref:Uncharacterized protein n=1 Tax=Oryza brachyantha TaxID=4533 RepID=J3LW89_ORYBR
MPEVDVSRHRSLVRRSSGRRWEVLERRHCPPCRCRSDGGVAEVDLRRRQGHCSIALYRLAHATTALRGPGPGQPRRGSPEEGVVDDRSDYQMASGDGEEGAAMVRVDDQERSITSRMAIGGGNLALGLRRKELPGFSSQVNISASDIKRLADRVIARSKETYDAVGAVPLDKVSFSNVTAPLAELDAQLFPLVQACVLPIMVSPSDDLRSSSAEAEKRLDFHFLRCSDNSAGPGITTAAPDGSDIPGTAPMAAESVDQCCCYFYPWYSGIQPYSKKR